jgi:hypothetical protein
MISFFDVAAERDIPEIFSRLIDAVWRTNGWGKH